MGYRDFSQYTFVYLTAIDILHNYPIEVDVFLRRIQPADGGSIPGHPLDRCLTLFFLNTVEHFPNVLSPLTNDEVLMRAASPYLISGGNKHLLEMFEAAHCVVLSVLSAPQNAELAAKHIPFYVDALLAVFPTNLSARQFRLAFKTLFRISSPPSTVAATHPELQAILLDLLENNAQTAPATELQAPVATRGASTATGSPPLSKQAVLVLTLLDVLPYLTLDLLEEWLARAALLVNLPADESIKAYCKQHFWEILVNGEMDQLRSQLCVAWWTSRGGQEAVVLGQHQARQDHHMSGALQAEPRATKI